MKIRITALDSMFSNYIRWIRDKGKCQRCGIQYRPPTSGLQCSHFHGRRKQSVRFDEENCTAMCHGCHAWLTANPIAHVNFMFNRLGEQRYNLLMIRANTPAKPDYKAIEIWLKQEMIKANSDVIGRKAL